MSAIRINLLPHRELRRVQQLRALIAMVAVAAVGGLLVVIGGHVVIAGMRDGQASRNAFLTSEIAKLDTKISEIAKLKEKTNALLARKQVVETLQTNRAQVVHLFDELASRLPEGIYLKSLRQAGDKLTLQGYAQSSSRVSTLMRNIEASEWITAPKLIEVHASTLNNTRVHEFILEASQTLPKESNPNDAPEKSARPAKP